MRVNRIYTQVSLETGRSVELEAGPSHHLSKVLRCKTGTRLVLFDGFGHQYTAQISIIEKKQVTVDVFDLIDNTSESPLHIELGIGISKGERMDFVVQKATELGVSSITPIFSERSEVKLTAQRLEKKLSHWNKVIISACEQCGRSQLPSLNNPDSLESWLGSINCDARFVLHHRHPERLNSQEPPASVALAIGPEGGLSDNEIKLALKHDFKALSLGPRILRTETAPLAAISLLQHVWGDM